MASTGHEPWPSPPLCGASASPGHRGGCGSFAASGAPLSQYLVWAEHATGSFGADALVFVIIANDFDQSLTRFEFEEDAHWNAAAHGLVAKQISNASVFGDLFGQASCD